MNPNYQTVGESFVKFYYQLFDSSREQLKTLYREHSMLSFEGQSFQGPENIMQKLQTLPFRKVQHIFTTVDCQPTSEMGVFVMVIGQLKADDDPAHGFSQAFILRPTDQTFQNYYVFNDAFRLTLHNQ